MLRDVFTISTPSSSSIGFDRMLWSMMKSAEHHFILCFQACSAKVSTGLLSAPPITSLLILAHTNTSTRSKLAKMGFIILYCWYHETEKRCGNFTSDACINVNSSSSSAWLKTSDKGWSLRPINGLATLFATCRWASLVGVLNKVVQSLINFVELE